MIYLDNAATTQITDSVLKEMIPYLSLKYGNASEPYELGIKSKEAINLARHKIAKAINAEDNQIYFTSCGSESDNWAIRSCLETGKKHIIISCFEHHAILNFCKYLGCHGYTISYIPVNKYGFVDIKKIDELITDDTAIVSIMFANNEIGTIQPIKKISDICKKHNVPFHTDAVQAIGHINIDVKQLGINMLSMSAHKFHGPKGIGALYSNLDLTPLIFGGQQEFNKRAGTENIPCIVGMGKAIEIAQKNINKNTKYVLSLREILIKQLMNLKNVYINGSINNRLPGNLNLRFDNVEAEALMQMLSFNDIAVSIGSACNSFNNNPSHVLQSIGLSNKQIHSSIRISIDAINTKDEIIKASNILLKSVNQLRKISI